MIPAERVYLDPGDRLAGRNDPPRPCRVVIQWRATQRPAPGKPGTPRNALVEYLDDGSRAVIPFSRRLRRAARTPGAPRGTHEPQGTEDHPPPVTLPAPEGTAMAMTPTTWPRSQHWTVDGFRVTILLYKSHRHATCHTCGRRGAIHCVWTNTRADGFSAGPTDFCDDHRPARGTLPDLDYERLSHDGKDTGTWTKTRERLAPVAAWPCTTCGQPSTVRREIVCDRCTDPAHYTVSTVRVMSITASGSGERTETSIGHEDHVIQATCHCEEHP